jgi:hypothetical protein
MTPVASAPAVGQYVFTPYNSVGPVDASYAFNSTDVTSAFPVLLNYQWPDTVGTTLAISNQLMGYAPEFTALLYNDFRTNMFALELNSCILGSISIPTKQEDFWISDFDFEATADASGNVLSLFSDQL